MKTSSVIAIAAVVLIGVAQGSAEPQRGRATAAPAAAISTLPAGNVQHGQYLAEHVAMCVECHSRRDAQGNFIPGEQYLGGNIPFAPPWPNDWAAQAPRNRGLVGYDDKAALRLLTEGAIGREGRRLRPPMPRFFMTTQDAADVIAYLRSLR
jgi:mono/diheme cytochrome c family protein